MIEYLQIGQIINTHGIKGEMKVLPLTNDIHRFDLLKKVFISANDNEESDISALQEYHIDGVKYHKGFVLLKLEGIDDINQVEPFKKRFILVHRKDAVKLPSDNYFICDLVGMSVYDVNKAFLGIITSIIKTGSNDVFIVKNDTQEILIPALKTIVKEISLESGIVSVELPGGLLNDEI